MTGIRGRGYSEHDPDGAHRNLTPLEQAKRIADLAQEKLAGNVTILDMRRVCSYTDFFVICTGQNPRQTRAIYEAVREGMKAEDHLVPRHVHGEAQGSWILVDYLDIVVHVFTPEARAYYRLEELWGDVPAVEGVGGSVGGAVWVQPGLGCYRVDPKGP